MKYHHLLSNSFAISDGSGEMQQLHRSEEDAFAVDLPETAKGVVIEMKHGIPMVNGILTVDCDAGTHRGYQFYDNVGLVETPISQVTVKDFLRRSGMELPKSVVAELELLRDQPKTEMIDTQIASTRVAAMRA